ncbi:Uma2 family endonuclease [Pampinifervens florentissimum]|uniref:Uma2 family endonuclease n=1 Tax=Pampinifervens florentissimum TaxID=1632019 RepID=UPI0013B47DDD|nr:Uma2 family endonuclease [Hydrogenobacter sp. T-8]QID32515.1 Uma2 family endonuclease [Hydrogenobacter sp. T-8]
MKILEKKTVTDYEVLPEGSPYQLIEGELVMSPAPGFEHQQTSINISHRLYSFLKQKAIGRVLYAPLDVYIDEENVYQPDIVVILKGSKAKITRKGVYGPPDVVVEILSPSTAYYDLTQKKDVYERSGVREYWIVDPLRRTFEVYLNTEEGFKLISKAKGKGVVRSEVLSLELELEEVFEGIEP